MKNTIKNVVVLSGETIDAPNLIMFTVGRRRKQWSRNLLAVRLSIGFFEPLESTSIHLIQSAIVRLIQLFPHNGINPAEVAEYNSQSKIEFEQIRDFLILHYNLNCKEEPFWRDRSEAEISDSLAHKMALFEENGKLFRQQNDLFLEASWLQVMLGQALTPKDYHPLANAYSEQQLLDIFQRVKKSASHCHSCRLMMIFLAVTVAVKFPVIVGSYSSRQYLTITKIE